MTSSPWPPHRERIHAEWVDYNGHMNVAYYVLVFDHATDWVLDQLDIGTAYRQRTNCSVFVGAMHVAYEREVMAGEEVIVTSELLAHDARKLILRHAMRRLNDPTRVALNEVLCLHVDLASRRSLPWPADVAARLARCVTAPSETGPNDGLRLSLRRTR